jgi:hypothetical protein
MPAKATHDIVATTGEYTDRATGEKKKRYTKCGTAFQDEQVRISLKLETVPVGPNWSGWLSLYPIERNQSAPRSDARQAQPERQASVPQHYVEDEGDDEIPF